MGKMISGVGGKALEITSLPLGIDRIEREGRFSRAGGACKDNQLMSRDIEREIGEVVLPGTADTEEIAGAAHGGGQRGPKVGFRKPQQARDRRGFGDCSYRSELGRGRARRECDRDPFRRSGLLEILCRVGG